MSFIFQKKPTLYSEFSGTGAGGVDFLMGGPLAKRTAITEGYFYLAFKNKFLRFDATNKTIENINSLDFTSFFNDGVNVGQGLKVGRTITIEDSVSNNNTLTINAISGDGKTITVDEALVDEDCDGVSIYDDTLIKAIDYYYNLIPNTAQENYLSAVDSGAIQRFSFKGLDDSDAGIIKAKVSSASFGWVTNEISDPDTGEADDVTIELVEITDHKQYFKITQVFKIAPYCTNDQIKNFQDISAPGYLSGDNSLEFICMVAGKFNEDSPVIDSQGSSFRVQAVTNLGATLPGPKGLVSWFNQNPERTRADFYLDSISGGIDVEKVNPISITIKSRSGLFDANKTAIALDFVYLPLDFTRYTSTPERNMNQNFLNDRYFGLITTSGDGEQFGTAYQVIKNVEFDFIDANSVVVNFDVDFSDEIKAFFKSLPEADRNYFFSVTTQDEADALTKHEGDCVPVLIPLAKVLWDKSNPDLLVAVDNLRAYQYPQINNNKFYTTIAGFEGDPFYVEFPFRVLGREVDGVSPTILKAGFQVVVTKAGQEDFVLEEKFFDTSLVRKLNGVQTIDVSESKDFKDLPDDYNLSSFKRDESFDDIGSGSDEADMYGFLLHHAGLLRYDFWMKLIQDAEQFQYDLFKEIENPTQAWATLIANGWELKLKTVITVQGYLDFSEDFYLYSDITCKAVGDAPTTGPTFTSETEYIDFDTDIIINGFVKGGKTLIRTTYTGDFSSLPSGYSSLFAYIFADYENSGGPNNRRFASTEFNSDEDSPFTATEYLTTEDDNPDHSWASKNVRIKIYNFTKAIVETIYDDSIQNWGLLVGSLLPYPKLGFMHGCFIKREGAVSGYVLSELGQRIPLENCES